LYIYTKKEKDLVYYIFVPFPYYYAKLVSSPLKRFLFLPRVTKKLTYQFYFRRIHMPLAIGSVKFKKIMVLLFLSQLRLHLFRTFFNSLNSLFDCEDLSGSP